MQVRASKIKYTFAKKVVSDGSTDSKNEFRQDLFLLEETCHCRFVGQANLFVSLKNKEKLRQLSSVTDTKIL